MPYSAQPTAVPPSWGLGGMKTPRNALSRTRRPFAEQFSAAPPA